MSSGRAPCISYRSGEASTSPFLESCGRRPSNNCRSDELQPAYRWSCVACIDALVLRIFLKPASRRSFVAKVAAETIIWHSFNLPTAGTTWSSSLQHTSFRRDFNQPISGVMWPGCLHHVTLGGEFNQIISGVVWPASHFNNYRLGGTSTRLSWA